MGNGASPGYLENDNKKEHCKTIAASGGGVGMVARSLREEFSETDMSEEQVASSAGVVTSRDASIEIVATAFIQAMAQHRHWERENSQQ